LVADGVHLADETLEFAFRILADSSGNSNSGGGSRAALVTDAIAAAGMPDGRYELGGQAVVVADRVARLTPASDGTPGSIAGSTLTMDTAFRRTLRITGSIVAAARAAATTPARALGLADRGSLIVGRRADIVTFTPDLTIAAVRQAGRAVPIDDLDDHDA
jgi:N-acetylglucosamine-6-phosphate deacetylase